MASRYLFATVTTIVMLCSSPLLAGTGPSIERKAAPQVEVSSSSFQRSKPEVSCELKVKEKYEYYDVDGTSVTDLHRQMKQGGTKWDDGKTYAAVTTWDIHYRYDMFDEDGKCSVKSVKTDVDIVYHLPRRVAPASGPVSKAAWDGYMVNLRHHEYGHKDLAVKAAGEINEVLSSLQNFGSQDELEREAKRRTDEKLRQMKEQQIGYDVTTRHGETQGAVLAAQ